MYDLDRENGRDRESDLDCPNVTDIHSFISKGISTTDRSQPTRIIWHFDMCTLLSSQGSGAAPRHPLGLFEAQLLQLRPDLRLRLSRHAVITVEGQSYSVCGQPARGLPFPESGPAWGQAQGLRPLEQPAAWGDNQ